MPCCARESTSLIIFEFVAVSSSSSLMRSRIGWVWRCTYFLRANGLIFPQKPWWLSYCNGALPVAVSPLGVVGDDDACDDWSLVVEFAGCWASAGSERTNATNNATTARFFIFDILRGGACCALRPRSSSALHAMRGRDRDLVRPWKTGHRSCGLKLAFDRAGQR